MAILTRKIFSLGPIMSATCWRTWLDGPAVGAAVRHELNRHWPLALQNHRRERIAGDGLDRVDQHTFSLCCWRALQRLIGHRASDYGSVSQLTTAPNCRR